jgi:hypothetical protein
MQLFRYATQRTKRYRTIILCQRFTPLRIAPLTLYLHLLPYHATTSRLKNTPTPTILQYWHYIDRFTLEYCRDIAATGLRLIGVAYATRSLNTRVDITRVPLKLPLIPLLRHF